MFQPKLPFDVAGEGDRVRDRVRRRRSASRRGARLSTLRERLVRDRRGRPERVDGHALVRREARRASASAPSPRPRRAPGRPIARPRRRRASRTAGSLGADEQDVLAAGRRSAFWRSRVDRPPRARGRVAAADALGAEAPRGGGGADRERLVAVRVGASPRGPSAVSAFAVRSGIAPASVSRIGAPTGGAIRLAAAIPDGQSSASTRVTAAGPLTPAGRGKDGERDARGVGHRVGAGDAGGVLGRERREAEVLRGLRLLLAWTTTLRRGRRRGLSPSSRRESTRK